jgi:hypothetical protein
MLSSTAYRRNIIPLHICYSISVQMIANRSICSYSDFNLAYVAKFQYKTGYAKKNKKKTGRYGNPQHTFFTNGIYFVQKTTEACLSNPNMNTD